MGCTVGKTTIYSSTSDSKRKDLNENIPHLSDVHKQAIKNNWQVLKQDVANIGVITYVSMFENRPELIQVFANFKGKNITELQNSGLLRQHALRVMATIDKCITRIDEPANMIYILREVGYHHKRYDVQAEYIQIILPHFLSAIKYHIRDSWREDLQEAWISFLSLIFYHIKEVISYTMYTTMLVFLTGRQVSPISDERSPVKEMGKYWMTLQRPEHLL